MSLSTATTAVPASETLIAGVTPRQLVLLVIGLGVLARLAIAATVGLGIDESYTVANARHFQLSYYDHPPLSFWLVRAMVELTGSEAPVVVRLPFILMFAGTTWAMFRLTERAFGAVAGGWAALLLNLSPVFGLTAGGWILPDGPLMLFLTLAALQLHKLAFDDAPEAVWRRGLSAGLWLGLACLSKYHGFLFGGGLLVFLVTAQRRWLSHPVTYAALALAMLVCLPLWHWNVGTDWTSFRFQIGRAGLDKGLKPSLVLVNLLGQILYILPWIWLPLIGRFFHAMAGGPRRQAWFFGCLAAVPIVLFSVLPLFGSRGLPHWQAPGYLMLFPLLGLWTAEAVSAGRRWLRPWLGLTIAAPLVVIPLLAAHIATGWIERLAPALFAGKDPTMDLLDWTVLADAVPAEIGFVVSPRWLEAGKVDTALANRWPVLVLTRDPRNFAFQHDQKDFLGQDAMIIGSERSMANAAAAYAPYFSDITPAGEVWVTRGGVNKIRLVMLRARNFHTPYPLPLGPGA